MSRILLWAPAPWFKSGYGVQGAQTARELKSLGHDVAIGAYWGLQHLTVDWGGIPVFGARVRSNCYGMDILPYFYRKWNADFVIILADAWVGKDYCDELKDLNVANWMPIDSRPLSARDELYLRLSGARPVAMSKHGVRMLEEKGFNPLYVPHSIDGSVYRPCTDSNLRRELRADIGADDNTFVIGINSANRDGWRKGFYDQFEAFRRYRIDNTDSLLYVHSLVDSHEGINLVNLAQDLGIADYVIYPDQDAYGAGEITNEMLVQNFYWTADVVSNCAWGEGFGLAPLEFQFCGGPTVVTDASAMTELAGPGCRVVSGDPLRVEGHQAEWTRPFIDEICENWDLVRRSTQGSASLIAEQRREFVSRYEMKYVTQVHWKPTIETLVSEFDEKGRS